MGRERGRGGVGREERWRESERDRERGRGVARQVRRAVWFIGEGFEAMPSRRAHEALHLDGGEREEGWKG